MENLQLTDSLASAVPDGAQDSSAQPGRLSRLLGKVGRSESSLTVKTSLLLAFASVLVGALFIGAFSLWQMGRINASTQALYEQEYSAGLAAEQIRGLVLRASRAQTQLLTATTAGERNDLGKDIDASVAEMDTRLSVVTAQSTGEDAQAAAKQLGESIAKWSKRVKAYVELVKSQPLDLIQMSPDVPSEDAGLLIETRKVEKSVDAVVKLRGESAQATMLHAGDIYKSSMTWLAGILAALVVLSIAICLGVTRRLSRQLGGEPSYAKTIASRIAEGELSTQIQLAPGDTESLLYSLQVMQGQLAQTMRQIAQSSTQVAQASHEIALGNQDLLVRTGQQAQSLDRTVTNMEQMTQVAERYASSATEAAGLSSKATNAAQRGGDVVARVAQTMNKISKTTESIHAHIGEIEGIAFQTNLLALNAAVEAAHAGEQGRGFAVVAAEVRALAKRCSTAALEINTMIKNSATEVREGLTLVQEADQTIGEMAGAVAEVSAVMDKLSSASLEQSHGIGEINTAIAQLEGSTQQNASMVDQAAAAAQSLDDQVQRLERLVARFSLA